MTARRVWTVVFVLLLAFVTFMTLTPNPEDTKTELKIAEWFARMFLGDPARADKAAHFIAYLTLGGAFTLAGLKVRGRRFAGIAAIAVYGAFLEQAQGWGGVRDAEVADAIANMLGAFTAYPAALVLERLFRMKAV